MFSPLAFGDGKVLYDITISSTPAAHIALSPFEIFREPLMVLGIADGAEYVKPHVDDLELSKDSDAKRSFDEEYEFDELHLATELLGEQHSRAIVHNLVLFNCPPTTSAVSKPPGALFVPPAAQLKTTTIKTVMCDLTSMFLAELTTLAKAYQALPTIISPTAKGGGQDGGNPQYSNDQQNGVSRRTSQITSGSRPESPVTSLRNESHRMSMPVRLPSANAKPQQSDSRPDTPDSGRGTPPATTFDEITGGSQAVDKAQPSNLSRSDSVAGALNTSRDRVSVHGFGSDSVTERARNKGKGRVGIVLGSLYLLAGRWPDALSELVESATRARAFSDHAWHAKGLENILVCLLLLAWSGLDFQVSDQRSSVLLAALHSSSRE